MANNNGVEYTENYDEARKLLDGWEDKALEAIGIIVDADAVLLAPTSNEDGGATGSNLKGSIRHIVDTKTKTVRIGTPVKYAIYVEKGTGIHAADGNSKAKKIPWWYKDEFGEWHITHGQEPQPFLTPAVENNIKRIEAIVKKVKFGHGIG